MKSKNTHDTKVKAMEIEIISRENIKPSSPTPSHLRNYKLSLLDQLYPSIYAPMLLFYPSNTTDHHPNTHEILELLKESLSKTLTLFYPFAGKVEDSITINCNDKGAYFVEARVKGRLTEGFLQQPNPALLQRLLPHQFSFHDNGSMRHASMFQVNVFDCGGIVISILVNHKIADGKAVSTFLKIWAAIASGSETESLLPSFMSSSLFPQNIITPVESIMATLSPFMKKGKCVTRRFKFDAKSLSALKAKATNLHSGHVPSRVQSVTAIIWKSFITTRTFLSEAQKPCFVSHAVDLRRRASPPFSESCIGNLIWLAWAKCKDECGTKLDQLVGEIDKAIKKIDAEFVKQLEGESGVFKYHEAVKGLLEEINKEAADCLVFSSWFNFGLYKVDFGWGKPALATCAGMNPESTYLSLVILVETKEGDGLEAWVTLDEQEMTVFECERELLGFASIDHD